MYKAETQGDMEIDWSKIGRLARWSTYFAEGREVMQS